MKWRPTCHKTAPDKLENGDQCCFNKFDCRLYISKFFQFVFYLSYILGHRSHFFYQKIEAKN